MCQAVLTNQFRAPAAWWVLVFWLFDHLTSFFEDRCHLLGACKFDRWWFLYSITVRPHLTSENLGEKPSPVLHLVLLAEMCLTSHKCASFPPIQTISDNFSKYPVMFMKMFHFSGNLCLLCALARNCHLWISGKVWSHWQPCITPPSCMCVCMYVHRNKQNRYLWVKTSLCCSIRVENLHSTPLMDCTASAVHTCA